MFFLMLDIITVIIIYTTIDVGVIVMLLLSTNSNKKWKIIIFLKIKEIDKQVRSIITVKPSMCKQNE